MGRWLFLPDSTTRDLATLAELPEESIRDLKGFLDADNPENMFSNYVLMAEKLRITDQEAASLYSFWEYVQREKKENKKNASSVVTEFIAFLKARAEAVPLAKRDEWLQYADRIQEKRAAIEILFGDYPRREQVRKSHSLEYGPPPHISNLKAYCDLRPVYDESGTRIVDCLPVVTLRVAIHDALDEHKEFFVQISEANIGNIEAEFHRLRDKLMRLKASLPQVLAQFKKG